MDLAGSSSGMSGIPMTDSGACEFLMRMLEGGKLLLLCFTLLQPVKKKTLVELKTEDQ